jgi:hypothetical protein
VRGPTTGCNEFFILSKEKAKEWGIEPEFLVPCVSSPKKIKGLVIRPEDVDEYFFMCDKPKEELKGTKALEYIEHGEKMEIEVTRGSKRERRKLPELETVKGRRLWYALPKSLAPDILFQYMIDIKNRVFMLKGTIYSSDVFHFINLIDSKDRYFYAAFLNSSLTSLLYELFGRSYGGGILKVQVYELKNIPIITPSTLTSKEKERLSSAFMRLSDAVDARVKAEEYLKSIKSTKKGQLGILEISL